MSNDPMMKRPETSPLFKDPQPAPEQPPPAEPAEVAATFPTLPMGKCKFCGAPVIFVKTSTGATMPVDPKAQVYVITNPGARPEDAIATNANTDEVKRHMQKIARNPLHGVWVSHFATCMKYRRAKK